MKKASEFIEQIATLHANARETAISTMLTEISQEIDKSFQTIGIQDIESYTSDCLETSYLKIPCYFGSCKDHFPQEVMDEVQSNGFKIIFSSYTEDGYCIRIPIKSPEE